jgi:hypothetical protein
MRNMRNSNINIELLIDKKRKSDVKGILDGGTHVRNVGLRAMLAGAGYEFKRGVRVGYIYPKLYKLVE